MIKPRDPERVELLRKAWSDVEQNTLDQDGDYKANILA